jgi:hypothetical protein
MHFRALFEETNELDSLPEIQEIPHQEPQSELPQLGIVLPFADPSPKREIVSDQLPKRSSEVVFPELHEPNGEYLIDSEEFEDLKIVEPVQLERISKKQLPDLSFYLQSGPGSWIYVMALLFVLFVFFT